MDASDVIATIALVFSAATAVAAGVSLYFGLRESRRRDQEIGHLGREAERREDEIAFLRREGERRDEELTLLAAQLEEEQDARREQLRARLVVEKGATVAADRIVQGLYITNTGPHPAFKVSVQLVDHAGTRVEPSYGLAGALMAGDTRDIEPTAPGGEYYRGPYYVYVEWMDGTGHNRKMTDVEVFDPAAPA